MEESTWLGFSLPSTCLFLPTRTYTTRIVTHKHTLTLLFLIQSYCRLAEEVADELVEEAGEELESILRGYAEDVFAWL